MFHSVALDVVIGLIFIYLLYSLLATVLSEIIATLLALRARNLREAIDRMLHDEKVKSFIQRIRDSLHLMKSPKNRLTDVSTTIRKSSTWADRACSGHPPG
jgi:hypothetical protein